MATTTRWHKLYSSTVAAPPVVLFELLSDMPNYGRWLPGSGQFGETTDVEPYPVRLGTRYQRGTVCPFAWKGAASQTGF